MHLNDKQRTEIHKVIEKAKQAEYKQFNAKIVKAVHQLQKGKRTEEEAYNKIYKNVIKNEHHLVHRYADLDDAKSLRTLAEVYTDEVISKDVYEKLDIFVKKEVSRITGFKG